MVRMKRSTAAKKSSTRMQSGEMVEAYIAGLAEPAQTRMRQLRAIIRTAAPKAAFEVISYGMPAFALPKPFFGYAAFKNHLSVFPFSGSFLGSFADELEGYSRTKSSLHLPYDKPLPKALIQRLVRARVVTLSR
jgi:uncharacterized protein YdhG (YjbR/CyaY superfamily)